MRIIEYFLFIMLQPLFLTLYLIFQGIIHNWWLSPVYRQTSNNICRIDNKNVYLILKEFINKELAEINICIDNFLQGPKKTQRIQEMVRFL